MNLPATSRKPFNRALAALAIAIALIVVSCCLTAFTTDKAFAASPKATKGATIHTLKPDTTYTKYDITGDGQPDTIEVETDYYFHWDDAGECFYVNINGDRWRFDTRYYGIRARLVNLANGTPYLYLCAWSDNDDAEVCSLWKKDGDYLRRVIDCNKGFGSKIGYHPGGDIKKVSGNSITFTFTQMSYYAGGISADFTYKYKNGTLKKTSSTGKIQVGPKKAKNTYKALKKIKAYKNTKCKSVKFTIKKGQKVKFLKAYVKGNTVRFQVKAGGRTGWLKVPTSSRSSLLHQGEPPFKGLHLAG